MKKELACKFAAYCCLDLDDNLNHPVDPDYEVSTNPLDSVLKEIFAVDPETGSPKGDLAYYLSPDGNPTIKSWLENNLLAPRGISNNTPEGVTDDMLAEFSRGADETIESYSQRMTEIYQSAIEHSKEEK